MLHKIHNFLFVFTNIDDQSDDESCLSVSEYGHSPDEDEERTKLDGHFCKKDCNKPWLSHCSDLPKRKFTIPLKYPNIEYKEENKPKKSISFRKKSKEKHNFADVLESSCHNETSEGNTKFPTEKNQLQLQSCSCTGDREQSLNKFEVVKQTTRGESETHVCSDDWKSPSCVSPPAILGNALIEHSEGTEMCKQSRASFSAVAQSLTLPIESQSITSGFIDGDDGVFEDYFLRAKHQSPQRSLLPIPVETSIQIPFQMDSVSRKRKQIKSESTGPETNSINNRKLEDSLCYKDVNCQAGNVHMESQKHLQKDFKESLHASNSHSMNVTSKRRKLSTLPFTDDKTINQVMKRKTSTSLQPMSTEAGTALKQQKNSAICSLCHNLESE